MSRGYAHVDANTDKAGFWQSESNIDGSGMDMDEVFCGDEDMLTGGGDGGFVSADPLVGVTAEPERMPATVVSAESPGFKLVATSEQESFVLGQGG